MPTRHPQAIVPVNAFGNPGYVAGELVVAAGAGVVFCAFIDTSFPLNDHRAMMVREGPPVGRRDAHRRLWLNARGGAVRWRKRVPHS